MGEGQGAGVKIMPIQQSAKRLYVLSSYKSALDEGRESIMTYLARILTVLFFILLLTGCQKGKSPETEKSILEQHRENDEWAYLGLSADNDTHVFVNLSCISEYKEVYLYHAESATLVNFVMRMISEKENKVMSDERITLFAETEKDNSIVGVKHMQFFTTIRREPVLPGSWSYAVVEYFNQSIDDFRVISAD